MEAIPAIRFQELLEEAVCKGPPIGHPRSHHHATLNIDLFRSIE
jgi:hypothetical protein